VANGTQFEVSSPQASNLFTFNKHKRMSQNAEMIERLLSNN
jgi:hypothetical protein